MSLTLSLARLPIGEWGDRQVTGHDAPAASEQRRQPAAGRQQAAAIVAIRARR